MIIKARFNGPPGSGNGGYSAGLFATTLLGPTPAEVTLRRPPPLDVPLVAPGPVRAGRMGGDTDLSGIELSGIEKTGADAARADGGGVLDVLDPDGAVVAQVTAAGPLAVSVPGVPWAEAVRAAASYAGFADHPFPTCYVCGPERADGLRIFPGRLPDGRTAAPFVVPADVTSATVWAALDCPGGWSIIAPGRPYVLGRMAAVVSALPAAGTECVVVGTTVSVTGRKALVHSTLYGPTGETLAYARATWIAI